MKNLLTNQTVSPRLHQNLQGLWPSVIDFTKPGKCFACRHSLLDLSLASEAQSCNYSLIIATSQIIIRS